jgi:hypothetical protein
MSKFEIVDLGVQYSDYFRGFGVSFTEYANCTVGIGNTAQEAYDDAADSCAQSLSSEEFAALGLPDDCPFDGSVGNTDEEDSNDYGYYYVGIRWNV